MSGGAIPLFAVWSRDLREIGRAGTVLVLTGDEIEAEGFAALRHAESAAAARQGTCACCRVPSNLATVLRQLVIERAGGKIDFDRVFVAGDDKEMLPRLLRVAFADPVVAARFSQPPVPR